MFTNAKCFHQFTLSGTELNANIEWWFNNPIISSTHGIIMFSLSTISNYCFDIVSTVLNKKLSTLSLISIF